MAIKSVGAQLREAREKQGFTLDDIGARTRITEKCLTAIERDDVSKLSSPFFYKSFVRQYAEQVGLDYEDLAARVDSLALTMREPDLPGQGEYPPVRVAPIQARIKRDFSWVLPSVAFLGVVAVISSGYAMWRYEPEWLNGTPVAAWVHNLKQTQGFSFNSAADAAGSSAVEVTKAATAVPEQTPSGVESGSMQPGASSSKETDGASSTDAKDSDKQKSADSDAVTAVIVPDGSARVDGGIHLELAATERTWLSVLADGKPAYSGIMEKEQVKVLDGQETAEVRTGNAAGVNITFNGRQLGAIGPRGTTRRVIFTKTGYEVFPQATNRPIFSRGTHIGG